MTTQPLVSVLIPLYNQERYFKACMRSVEAQKYKNLEIIIVNDGSTDHSPQMVRDWAARDNRVRLVDKQNEGPAFARRDGCLAATGEYVTFLDSDDMLAPDAIETMLSTSLGNDVDLVLGLYDKQVGFIRKRKNDRGSLFPFNQIVRQPELFDKYYVGFYRNDIFPISACAKLYRKSVIDRAYQETELYSPDIRFMGEDQFFNLKLFPYLNSMYRIDKTVYIYRYGGGTFGFNRHFPEIFSSSDKRLKLLDQFNYSKGYEPLFAEYVACFYHHAAQMINFKKASKATVVDYFMKEISERELMPRLVEFYRQRESNSRAVQLLLDQNYEGMFQYACEEANKLYGSIKYKAFKSLVSFFSRF